jgi:uncharacterized membrane protein
MSSPDPSPRRTNGKPLDRLLHPREQRAIVEAIRLAEANTTAELKVHVEARCPATDAHTRAVELFDKLGLHRTGARNGVLVYAATHERRYAVIGDVGIGEQPGGELWAEALRQLSIGFRRGAFGEAIVGAIRALGERLRRRFPAAGLVHKDEIDNAISTEDTLVRT